MGVYYFVLSIVIIMLPSLVIIAIFKSKKKHKIIMLIAIITLILSTQLSFVQEMTARLTAMTYVTSKYFHRGFKIQDMEWDGPFGAYNVSFEDKNGEIMSIQVISKKIPIVVIYDSLNPGP